MLFFQAICLRPINFVLTHVPLIVWRGRYAVAQPSPLISVSITLPNTATQFLSFYKTHSLQHMPLRKADRNTYILRSQELTKILAQRVIRTTSIIPTVQTIRQQKVHSPHIAHFETIDRLPCVFYWAQ